MSIQQYEHYLEKRYECWRNDKSNSLPAKYFIKGLKQLLEKYPDYKPKREYRDIVTFLDIKLRQ